MDCQAKNTEQCQIHEDSGLSQYNLTHYVMSQIKFYSSSQHSCMYFSKVGDCTEGDTENKVYMSTAVATLASLCDSQELSKPCEEGQKRQEEAHAL